MSIQCCPLSSRKTSFLAFSHPKSHFCFRNAKAAACNSKFSCVNFRTGVEDIAEVVHNKVLIAAGVSAAIGQLSKPFSSNLIYGKPFDLKNALQAGGFPSTHSSSVVAAATCLALERGFSDSVFGLTVVYAGLIMYDAQGVRREVGIHAKALNRLVSQNVSSKDRDGRINYEQGERQSISRVNNQREASSPPFESKSLLLTSSDVMEEEDVIGYDSTPIIFKEAIGHTVFEVVAGALLGFVVSLAVNAIL